MQLEDFILIIIISCAQECDSGSKSGSSSSARSSADIMIISNRI